jgi:hypothetical protein
VGTHRERPIAKREILTHSSGAEPALALRSSLTPIRGGDYGQFLPLRGTFREMFATAFANCFSNSR